MGLTGGWGHLAAALLAFLAGHALIRPKALRQPAEALLGKAGFMLAYSLLSLALLVWVVAAALDAPLVVLWEQRPWMRLVPSLVMPVACLLWVAGATTPNPFSIGPGGARFDPARPGILRLARHPVLWGLALWSGGHLIPNGTLSGLALFLPMLLFSLAGPRMMDRRRQRRMGPEGWAELAAPLAGPVAWGRLAAEIGIWRVLAGLGLVPLLMALHPHVIGRNPFP